MQLEGYRHINICHTEENHTEFYFPYQKIWKMQEAQFKEMMAREDRRNQLKKKIIEELRIVTERVKKVNK